MPRLLAAAFLVCVASPVMAFQGPWNVHAQRGTIQGYSKERFREDTSDLDQTIDDAFPGACLAVPSPGRTASFGLIMPEYPKRVFEAEELSDGTLRYLAIAGALLGYRLPSFIALNEPETSLHPDLLEPLARLILRAGQRTQIWVVTHSERLAQAFMRESRVTPRTVIKRNGATWIDGLKLSGTFGDDD